MPDQVPRKIILDCDPGHDDAIAMLLAHGNPDVELVAVTTVVGNHTLPNVTRNALAVATVAGITGVPFAAGCPRPLLREVQISTDIHGVTGLDGPELPESTVPLDARHAVDLIIDTVLAHRPGEITLVPTAGLTNIALAVRKEPRLAELVREVVLMGGGYHAGNLTPVAEFNIAIDPEAAHIVFHEPWPLVMVGLDLTHQALATPAVFDAITAVGTRPAQVVIDILQFFRTSYAAVQGFESPPVHDPCAVAYVIDPSVVAVRRAPVDIELHGALTTGMTVTDLRAPAPPGCTTSVATELDHARFWKLVVDALTRIGDGGGQA